MKTHRRRTSPRRTGHAPAATGAQAASALARARTKLGAPYVLATAGPETFDCSGFTWWVAEPIIGPLDFELRSSHHQFNVWGEPVPGEALRPGDLLFFDSMGVTVFGNRASHVGLYLGEGRFVHASGRHHGVVVSDLAEPYYQSHWAGARRLVGAASIAATSR